MSDFLEAFKIAERSIRPRLEAQGFKLYDVSVTDNEGTQWVSGTAKYVERRAWHNPFKAMRFITLSAAPLRLELDLDIGVGERCHSIFELHDLVRKREFPERKHDLYKAMSEGSQLSSEFQRLVDVLESCGKRFFLNDPALWKQLEEQRAKHHRERENMDAFRAAERAFKEHDWETVVKLLEEKYQFLGELESKRLIYAMKKLNMT